VLQHTGLLTLRTRHWSRASALIVLMRAKQANAHRQRTVSLQQDSGCIKTFGQGHDTVTLAAAHVAQRTHRNPHLSHRATPHQTSCTVATSPRQTLTDSEVRRSETQNKQRAPPHDELGSANKQANALQAQQSNNPPTHRTHATTKQPQQKKRATRNAQRATVRHCSNAQQRTNESI